MKLIQHSDIPCASLPGLSHVTIAGSEHGVTQFSVWKQILQPGAATPPHRHDCDEIVICQKGTGKVHLAGEVLAFGADSTVVIDRNEVHQIFNTGPAAMEIIGIFGMTPVDVFLPNGDRLELPWRS